nr:probable nhoA protein - Mycobacterium tuberculosis (strain H37RV) [Mycobacterium tuberculosis]
MALDLTAYFDRINYRGATDPTLDVLQDLVTVHSRTIPFENLDPLLGVPVDDLSPQALADKLVLRRRGGYCFEHNGLMGYVLAELGYRVRRFAARVVWKLAPDAAPAAADAHPAGGHVPRLGRMLSRRRRIRRPNTDLTASPRNRRRPADNARTLSARGPRRRLCLAGDGPGHMADTVRIHHPDPPADRSESGQLVRLNTPGIEVRHGTDRRGDHRRRPVEPIWPRPCRSPCRWYREDPPCRCGSGCRHPERTVRDQRGRYRRARRARDAHRRAIGSAARSRCAVRLLRCRRLARQTISEQTNPPVRCRNRFRVRSQHRCRPATLSRRPANRW